ncbi:ribonuclease III domain-containing protein [Ampelomyces quisqualis]|uniref:Ribonuclease III domain-containing protein n=1 Tax=Ampelomyces quisqualis TaxID=50730 RepID=A0A6A5QJL1_AMPQU|nr:ribonuclease III domain-containing protein [Ampelomyces quisqualis]
MSVQKRGNGFGHYGDHSQPFNKKQRYSQPMYNSASSAERPAAHHRKPPQYGPHQPQLSATELQTGLVALLDRFVAAELTPEADRDILLHARELRRLVSARTAKSTSAQARRDLDEKRPDKAAYVTVPDYIDRKVVEAKHLPPLPPITEPHLEQAVFTHQSVHANHFNVHQHIDLGLDYERLEYLGDAYIELMASRSLYNRFPVVDVPQLCSWRERLVENIALAKFSEAYGFPDRLQSKADYDKTSKAWTKVTADIFEAYVAAVVLSDPANGFRTAENWLDDLWAPQILSMKEKVTENAVARDDLNKLVVINGVQVNYREERAMVVDRGAHKYFLGAYLTGWGYEDEWLGSGEGQKKSQACIAAANDAIKRDSPALRDAARQKKELMAIRAKERELAEAANGDQGDEVANEDNGDEVRLVPESTESPERAKKKRKSEAVEPPEKKTKKHKKSKDKTEKQNDKEK